MRSFRIVLIVLMGIFSFVSGVHSASWEKYSDNNYVLDWIKDGKTHGRFLGVPHYAQKKKYTCGATTTEMQFQWNTYLAGREVHYDQLSLYSYLNTIGGEESGLTPDELKVGQEKLTKYTNNRFGINMKWDMEEIGKEDIAEAVRVFYSAVLSNIKPAIMYGNTLLGGAGGHYYLIRGAVNCSSADCGNAIVGFYLNDSFYDSPAYDENLRIGAIKPRTFIDKDNLASYWKETGHWNPLKRKHMMLINN